MLTQSHGAHLCSCLAFDGEKAIVGQVLQPQQHLAPLCNLCSKVTQLRLSDTCLHADDPIFVSLLSHSASRAASFTAGAPMHGRALS